MESISIETKNIKLRPLLPSDVSEIFNWMYDLRNLHLWWADRTVLSYKQFVEDLNFRLDRFFGHFFVVEDKGTDAQSRSIIGLTYTYNVNYVDHHSYLCVYLIPERTQKGIGYDVGYTMCNYLFSTFGFRKIYAEIFEYNTASTKICMRNGFLEEGRLLNHRWYLNKYWDLIILALTRESFMKQKRPEVASLAFSQFQK